MITEGESYDGLLDRVAHKAGLEASQTKALKSHKDGGLAYEYQGEKYSLEDSTSPAVTNRTEADGADDDLEILLSRLPPSSTSSTTLHLSLPSQASSHPHAHFAPSPPSYSTAAETVKSKAQRSQSQTSTPSSKPQANGNTPPSALKSPKSKDYASVNSTPNLGLGAPIGGANGDSHSGAPKTRQSSVKAKSVGGGEAKTVGTTADGTSVGMVKPARRAQSVASTRSRRSKYGDPNAEPMGDVHKRNWEAVSRATES